MGLKGVESVSTVVGFAILATAFFLYNSSGDLSRKESKAKTITKPVFLKAKAKDHNTFSFPITP